MNVQCGRGHGRSRGELKVSHGEQFRLSAKTRQWYQVTARNAGGLLAAAAERGVYPGASRGTSFVYIAELDNFKQAELQHSKRSMHLPA